METTKTRVMLAELTLIEPLLGTLAGDPNIATEFILSKHPDGQVQADEVESLGKVKEKASTIFSRNADNQPILWDYQVKGFFKSACKAMIETDTFTKAELKEVRLTSYLHKRTIDTQLFIAPRRLVLRLPDGVDENNLDFLERPLRGETMRGERISLARSEMCPAGTKLKCQIIVLNDKLFPFISRWLDYGKLNGLGQWRNSGMGRFSWKEIKSNG